MQHEVSSAKGEVQERVESLSTDATRLETLVNIAAQMRFHCHVCAGCRNVR